MKRPRIIVGGFLGLVQAGGVTWDYVQYPLGLHEMGLDVYYIEDTRLWPIWQDDSVDGPSCASNVKHLAGLMDEFGMGDRWAYRDEMSGECFGMSIEKVLELCRTADVLLNVSCSTFMREEYHQIPVRALLDSDPMFTQIQYETSEKYENIPGESGTRQMLDAHTHFFTFGENIGADDCRVNTCGIEWKATRQPVVMSWWPHKPIPALEEGRFTTVMNWTAGSPLEYKGEKWGQKNVEFLRFMETPARVPKIPLSVAVGQTTGAPFPTQEAERHGWHVGNPHELVPDWRSYREFIERSYGEFAIAKETYVKALTGWFSCRSACYLAAGRPVVTQDTGWSKYYPTGEGLFAFDDVEGAVAALREAASDPQRQSRAARRIAEEHLDSAKVLGEMLEYVRSTPARTSPGE
jgi:hypothetical protein